MTLGLELRTARPAPPELEFILDGEPRGAMRPRVQVRGKHAHVHMDDQHIRDEARFVRVAVLAWRRPVLDCPVRIEVDCYFSRTQAFRKVKRNRGASEAPYIGKPDADNVAKLVMDALTKAGVWCDDTRVSDLAVRRRYIALDAEGNDAGLERVEVRLWKV